MPRSRTSRFISSVGLITLALAGVCRLQIVSAQAVPPAAPVSVIVTDVALTVSPANIAVQAGATQQFSVTVVGTTSASIIWTSTGGSISKEGLFTAGSIPGSYVIAASMSDGTASVAIPVFVSQNAPVTLRPGDDVAAAVSAAAQGTAFVLKAGMYRLTNPLTPKDGNVFAGQTGAILSGARLLSNFSQSGSYWFMDGQTQQGQIHGVCRADAALCSYPEDLYFDDVPLQHVATLAEVVPGKWYFDYAADRIYFADDPTGHRVETTVTRHAFGGGAANVTISGLIIEKFANPAQAGAVDGALTRGWTVQDNELRFNHGVGVRIGDAMQLLRNHIHHNGQMGLGGIGRDVLVADNEIASNNTLGFDQGWEAGGAKFVKTRNLIVRRNFSHHNAGPGLWTDIDNIDTTYEYNVVEDNYAPAGTTAAAAGIFHEISYSAIIRYNTVRRNGRGFDAWGWGAGIVVAASGGSGVEIYGNILEDNQDGIMLIQQNRGFGLYGPYLVQNVDVHHNTIRMTEGWTGAVQDIGDSAIFTSHNNRFHDNSYYLGSNSRYFAWMNVDLSESGWKGYGQDLNGSFVR